MALIEGGNIPYSKLICCILAVCSEVAASDARTVTGCCIRLAFMERGNTLNVHIEVAVSDESTVGDNSLLHKDGVNGGGQHPESAQGNRCFSWPVWVFHTRVRCIISTYVQRKSKIVRLYFCDCSIWISRNFYFLSMREF